MKKYILFLLGVFCVSNVNAEGIILSDTSLPEEDVVVDNNSGETSTYVKQSYTTQQNYSGAESLLSNDTSDPLFKIGDNQFLSDTFVDFPPKKMLLGQYLGYGINNNLYIHANIHYQFDFSGRREYGFSSTDLGGVYRLSHGFNQSKIISDVLFGLKAWGSSHVRTPEYADSSYYAGIRMGRQYTSVTLAGTVKSTWVFDNTRGLSYIDFIPEAYFRFKYDWRAGIGLDIRRSTNTHLLEDQEWLNFKLVRQYGNTQYVGKIGYEFGDERFQLGASVKILF
ncbi:MAG: hypothetical protein IKN73_02750 [Alphaproteobacteria bacterium]|nr:hypothetical protein [Alphaproteobacteria bacterium]